MLGQLRLQSSPLILPKKEKEKLTTAAPESAASTTTRASSERHVSVLAQGVVLALLRSDVVSCRIAPYRTYRSYYIDHQALRCRVLGPTSVWSAVVGDNSCVEDRFHCLFFFFLPLRLHFLRRNFRRGWTPEKMCSMGELGEVCGGCDWLARAKVYALENAYVIPLDLDDQTDYEDVVVLAFAKRPDQQ